MTKAASSDSKSTLSAALSAARASTGAQAHPPPPTVFGSATNASNCAWISIREEHKIAFVKSKDGVPTPREIREVLDDYVIGQDHAKVVLAVAVYNPLQAPPATPRRTTTSSWGESERPVGRPHRRRQDAAGPDPGPRSSTCRSRWPTSLTLTEAGYVGEDIENCSSWKLLQASDYPTSSAPARHRLHRRSRQDQPQVRQPLDHPRRLRRGRATVWRPAEDHGRHRRLGAAAEQAQAPAAGVPASTPHTNMLFHLRRALASRAWNRSSPAAARKTLVGFSAKVADPDDRAPPARSCARSSPDDPAAASA